MEEEELYLSIYLLIPFIYFSGKEVFFGGKEWKYEKRMSFLFSREGKQYNAKN